MGDFNIFDPEEGRFNFWNQTFTDGEVGNGCPLSLFLLAFSKLSSLTIRGETPQLMVLYDRFQGLVELFSIFLCLKRATSIATPMFLRAWRSGPY